MFIFSLFTKEKMPSKIEVVLVFVNFYFQIIKFAQISEGNKVLINEYRKNKRKMLTYMYYVHQIVEHQQTKNRTIWNLNHTSTFWEIDCQKNGPQFFKANFRMLRSSFDKLCEKFAYMNRMDTGFRSAIPLDKRVAKAIYTLGPSSEYRTIGNLFGVGKSTVCSIFLEFCEKAWTILAPEYMNFFPLKREYVLANIEDFWKMGFPQCFGAIDGCHIEVHPRKDEASDYYNYKGWYSVVLLALVDAKYRFTYINVGNAGRCNDSGIFETSTLKCELQKCAVLKDLSMEYEGTEIPALLLGDSAFRLSKLILKPYPYNADNSPKQREFNYRLSKCRRVVENSFGHLKARFRRLGKGIDNHMNNVKSVITAACVLHNFLISEKDVVQENWLTSDDSTNRAQPTYNNVDNNRSAGEAIRNAMANYISEVFAGERDENEDEDVLGMSRGDNGDSGEDGENSAEGISIE